MCDIVRHIVHLSSPQGYFLPAQKDSDSSKISMGSLSYIIYGAAYSASKIFQWPISLYMKGSILENMPIKINSWPFGIHSESYAWILFSINPLSFCFSTSLCSSIHRHRAGTASPWYALSSSLQCTINWGKVLRTTGSLQSRDNLQLGPHAAFLYVWCSP